MRHLLALLLLACSLPALSLTVNSDFATDEDTPLVFDFGALDDHCTDDPLRTAFRVSGVYNGALETGTSSSGPWSNATLPVILAPGTYLRFLPTPDTNGDDLLMLAIEASDGTTFSVTKTVNIDIAAINDPLTAQSGVFDQAGATVKVTEDVVYAFTWQQLIDTLLITEVDNQAWEIVLTDLTQGEFWTPLDAVISSAGTSLGTPPAIRSEVAFKWRAPAHVFTKATEPAIAVCAMRIRNTPGGLDPVDVDFATPVLGTSDALAPTDPSTLSSIDPLPVVVDVPRTLTYEDIRNAMHGTNDLDRCGQIELVLNEAAMSGAFVDVFIAGTYSHTVNLPSATQIWLVEGRAIRITVPSTTPVGLRMAGTASIKSSGSTYYSTPAVPMSIQVSMSGGGGGGGGAGGDSGGACGAGGAVAGLILLLALPLRRRRR